MSNGTSLSFLVYMIYNKSIWKYKGEESGYMEKAMEKIKNMKNGTASEKQYRVRKTIPGQKVQIYGSGNGTCDRSFHTVFHEAGICRGKIYSKPERV